MGRLLITKTNEDITNDDRTRFILEHTYVTNFYKTINLIEDICLDMHGLGH
jgi:hypothetical protein